MRSVCFRSARVVASIGGRDVGEEGHDIEADHDVIGLLGEVLNMQN